MTTPEEFEAARQRVLELPVKPSKTLLLQLYALYKQATKGDVEEERPSTGFNFKAIAKYDAWNGLRGTSQDDARQQYVDLVNELAK